MKNKKMVILLGVVIIVLIALLTGHMVTTKNTFSIEPSMNGITEEDLVVGEKIKVTSIAILNRSTGTPTFSANDEAGNDSSADNNIVRTFDDITWTIEPTFGKKDPNDTSVITSGVIQMKATVPVQTFEGTPRLYKWDTSTLTNCMNVSVSSDGTEIVANYRITGDEPLDSIKRQFVFKLRVLGAPNGMEIEPTFTFNMAGNDDEEKTKLISNKAWNEDTKPKDSKIVVSARAQLDINIVRNASLNYRSYFDFEAGNSSEVANDNTIKGNMLGFGLAIHLPEDLKGVELPKGPITFDLELNELVNGVVKTSEENWMPTLWDHKYNDRTNIGKNGRNMYWHDLDETSYIKQAPYTTNTTGTNWLIEKYPDSDNVYKITFSDYTFNDNFSFASYSINMGKLSKKWISNYYFEAILQTPEEVGNIQTAVMKAEIKNLKYTSISSNGDVYSEEYNLTNNGESYEITLLPNSEDGYGFPTYSRNIFYNAYNTNGIARSVRNRPGYLTFRFRVPSVSMDKYIWAMDYFIKIDNKGIVPTLYNNNDEYTSKTDPLKLNALYAIFDPNKDLERCQKGWLSDSEMTSVYMDDDRLKYYDTLEEASNSGCEIIGILFESQKGRIRPVNQETWYIYYLPYIVKADAEIGEVYQVITGIKIYGIYPENMHEIDVNNAITLCRTQEICDEMYPGENKTPQSHLYTNNPADYPQYVWSRENVKYNKTVYSGTGKSGGHNLAPSTNGVNSVGDSLLIIGAYQEVSIKSTNRLGNKADTYDLGLNQNIATFEVTPSITNDINNTTIDGIKIKVETTLPDGLTYVPNTVSCEDYEIDGNKIICYFENQEVNKEMEKITFDTLINEDTPNNTTYTLTTYIEEIPVNGVYKLHNSHSTYRRATANIKIINPGGYSSSKVVLNPVLEENGEVKYVVRTSNTTDNDMTEFRLLDILPYNGDGRGTHFEGTYTVSDIEFKVISNGTVVNNHNIKLYTSNSDGIKGKDAKTVDMGLFTEVTGNIPEQITGYLLDGTLPKRSKIEVTVTLQTDGNKGSDKYVNSATTRTSTETEVLQTANAISEVVNRIISGTVWIDKNGNGLLDENEQKLKNTNVRLLNTNNTELATKTTNKDGFYEFTRLARGKYKIEIEHDNNYYVTEKNVGSNTSINSKMNEDGISDEITKLDSISHGTIHQAYMNMGIVTYSKLIVNHYIEGTKDPVPLANGQDAPQVITEDKIGSSYTTSAVETLPYYELVETPSNATGEYQEEDTIVDYYYRLRKYPYTVNYYEYKDGKRTTNKISESKEFSDIVYGTKIYATDYVEDEIGIYIYKEWDKEYIEIGASENVINLYYEKKDNQVIVDYVEEGNEDKKLADRELISGKIGNPYETEQKEIPGYTFVRHTNNITGNIGEEVIHVIYYYQKNKYQYTVNYLELGTNKELKESKKVLEKEYLDVIYSKDEIIEIEKYSYHSFDKEKIEISIDEKENVINLYYVRNKNKVIVKYIDKDTGKEIEERESSTGEVGSKYTTTKKEIEGYTFTGDSGNTEGEYTDDEIIVIYYYTKVVPEVPVEVDIPQTIDTIFTYVFTIGISIITILISIYYIKRNKKSKK